MSPPIYLDRTDLVQQEIVTQLAQICPTQWAFGEPTEDGLPSHIYTLTWMGSTLAQTHERASSIYTIDSYTIDVETSEAGRDLAVAINGTTYQVTATDASPTTLRGLLLAAIQSDTEAPYTTVGVGASEINIIPTGSGSLLSARIPIGGDLVETTTDHAVQPHEVTRSTASVRIQLQAWAPSTSPRLSAHVLLAHGQSLLQGPVTTLALSIRQCVIQSWDQAIDLTAIAGAKWASRAAAEFVLGYETKLVTESTRIQTTTQLLEISP